MALRSRHSGAEDTIPEGRADAEIRSALMKVMNGMVTQHAKKIGARGRPPKVAGMVDDDVAPIAAEHADGQAMPLKYSFFPVITFIDIILVSCK